MAGNKALKKFVKSKIPKKGKGPSIKEINIHKEPNIHSEIIGKIKSGEVVNWISKSICDNREWIRCDKSHNFGYAIGTEEDCNYNFNIEKITICPEKKSEASIPDIKTLTNEELKIGEEALNEILNEEDLKINFEEDSNENSTEAENNSFENTLYYKDDNRLDILNNLNFNEINFKTENDLEIKKADLILNEIFTELDKEQKPKVIEIPKKDENPEKKNEEPSTFRKILSSVADLIPIVGNIKSGFDAISGNDLITNEKLDNKERLMRALSLIPGMNYINKGKKIGKSLAFGKNISKSSKVIKASKSVGKNGGKKISKILAKKGGKKSNSYDKKNVSKKEAQDLLKPKNIPSRLIKEDGKVDLSKFDRNKKNMKGSGEKGGYYIEKDFAEHGGRKWKLKDSKGKRIASLAEDGTVLSH